MKHGLFGVLMVVLLVWACVLTQCAPATRAGACDTSDLDAAYYDDLVAACWDHEGPLSECPGYSKIAHDYEEKATARCTQK